MKFKKIIAAILCTALYSLPVASASVSPTMANRNNISIQDIETPMFAGNFKNHEKIKFPHGKFWNGGNPDSYTNVKCSHPDVFKFHNNILTNAKCNSFIADRIFGKNFSAFYDERQNNCSLGLTGYQCLGYALKLQYDFYGTTTFVGLKYDCLQNNVIYKPRIGDNIRYDGHSIFVTNVREKYWRGSLAGYQILYSDCDSVGTCQITWNFDHWFDLPKNIQYVFRPLYVGDVNADSNIDEEDIAVLSQIINGTIRTDNSYRNEAADINNDNTIDYRDIVELRKFVFDTSPNMNLFTVIK